MRYVEPASALLLVLICADASAQPAAPNWEPQLPSERRGNQPPAQAELLVPQGAKPAGRGSGLHVYMGFTCDDPGDLACVSQGLRAIRLLIDSVKSADQTRCEAGRPGCPDQDLPPNQGPQTAPPSREAPNSPGDRKPNWPADSDPSG
jgi:hypothetical protein